MGFNYRHRSFTPRPTHTYSHSHPRLALQDSCSLQLKPTLNAQRVGAIACITLAKNSSDSFLLLLSVKHFEYEKEQTGTANIGAGDDTYVNDK